MIPSDPREYDLKRCPDCAWAPVGMAADCKTCDDTRLVSIHFIATYDTMEWEGDDE